MLDQDAQHDDAILSPEEKERAHAAAQDVLRRLAITVDYTTPDYGHPLAYWWPRGKLHMLAELLPLPGRVWHLQWWATGTVVPRPFVRRRKAAKKRR